jgi:hypothetical protein
MKGAELARLCVCFRGLGIYTHFTLINLFVKDDERDLKPGIGCRGSGIRGSQVTKVS